MIEKRNVARHRVLKGRERPVGIPEHFSLVLPADGLRMSCHVVWRKEKRIGIAFDEGRFFLQASRSHLPMSTQIRIDPNRTMPRAAKLRISTENPRSELAIR